MIRCSQCGSGSHVDSTRMVAGDPVRVRECKRCGRRWMTKEVKIKNLPRRIRGRVKPASWGDVV